MRLGRFLSVAVSAAALLLSPSTVSADEWGFFNIRKFFATDGTSIAYRATTLCKPNADRDFSIIYFPGTASSSAYFGAQLNDPTNIFTKKNICQVAIDFRGNGDSASVGPYTFAQAASDAKDLLVHLGIPTATIAGWSQGGPVALAFFNQYPAYVASIAFMSSSPGYLNTPAGWTLTAPYTLGYPTVASLNASIQFDVTLLNTGGVNGSNRTAYDAYFFSIFTADYGTKQRNLDNINTIEAFLKHETDTKATYNGIIGNREEWLNFGFTGLEQLPKINVSFANYGEVGYEYVFQGNGQAADSYFLANAIPLPTADSTSHIPGPYFFSKDYYGATHIFFIQLYREFNYDLADFVSRGLVLDHVADSDLFVSPY